MSIRVPKFHSGTDSDGNTNLNGASFEASDSEDASPSDDDDEKQINIFRFVCVGVLIIAASIGIYLGMHRSTGLQLGEWTLVDSGDDAEGISVRVPEPPETKMVQRSESPVTKSVPTQPPPPSFCNASMAVIEDWGIRGPFNLSDFWDEKCHSSSSMPPMTWNWPGRNWCWVRTKTRSCYPHDGEKTVPNWYWAQKRVFEKGFAPDPDKEVMPGLVDPQLCDMPQLGGAWMDTPEEQKKAATAWVNDNIAIYVVNLPTSVERWQAMESRFAELGLKGHRIPGVDLRADGAIQRAQQEGLVPKNYSYDTALKNMHALMARSEKGGILKLVDEMGVGTVGCAAAHLRAQRLAHQLTKRAGKPMALIMEDDIWLSYDFAVKIQQIIYHEMPCNWDVYALTTRCGYGKCVAPHVSRVQPDGNEPDERCHNSGNYGMFGQLYRVDSIPKINQLLQEVCFNDAKPACLPVDIALASISDRIAYYAAPGSQQPGMASEAAWGGSNRADMNKQALKGADKGSLDQALGKKTRRI